MHYLSILQVNEHFRKTSINFAVESLDPANIGVIVNQMHTNLDHKYEHQSPLYFLASQLTDANYKPVFECIRLLIERQANPNISNQRDITPIISILKNKELEHDRKKAIVLYLLQNAPDIDLDNYRKGEARKLMVQQFPNLDLPPVAEKLDWNFVTLMRALNNGREAAFLRGLSELYETLSNDELQALFSEHDADETLMIVAARRNYTLAVERMIRLGANINYKISKNSSPIEVACHHGRWKVLELLLNTPNIELRTAEPLLSIIVKRVGDYTSDTCNFDKCFDLLIDHPGCDVDRTDINGCSALHYAVSYGNQRLALRLLAKGAYIGVNNKFDRLAIHNISPRTLETHLNACITTNDSRSGEEKFEIVFDYLNLVPDCYRTKYGGSQGRALPSLLKRELNEFKNEMTPIHYIAQSKDLRHLVTHPLIASFVYLKWARISTLFYINLALFIAFFTSILIYIFASYLETHLPDALNVTLRVVCCILTIGLIIRECGQFLLSPKLYLKSVSNYFEIALIVLTTMILIWTPEEGSWKRSLAATTILLAFADLFQLVGSLKYMNFSKHLIMLKTVSISFLKSFMLYSLIFIAFSLCFFTLLNEKSATSPNNTNQTTTGADAQPEEDDDFNKFSNIGTAFLKTLVMLTGEFEAASINFELNRISYVIFVVFLFLISTVLFNLLSGLAVNDIQVEYNIHISKKCRSKIKFSFYHSKF